MNSQSTKKEKIIATAIIATVILAMLAIYVIVGIPLVKFISEPQKFRTWIDQRGAFGPLIYIGLVFFQVIVAIIPGEPLELAGGYAFGSVLGTIYCLIGATLGSIAVFLLVKKYGMRLVEIFFPREKVESLRFLHDSPKRNFLFFIIFTIPGTPKDLLCYVVGITDMKLWLWLCISSLGRLPALITSTVGGDALGEQSYLTAIIVFAVTLAISGIGLLIYRLICKRNEQKNDLDIQK